MNLSEDEVPPMLDALPIATGSANFRDKQLVQLAPHEWALQPSWKNRLLLGGLCLAGAVLLTSVVIAKGAAFARDSGGMLALAAMLVFVLFTGVAAFGTLPKRLDRASRTITYGYRFRPTTRALDDLAAVQVIAGRRGKGYQPFELNLAFQDGQRINLSNNSDLPWTRETARSLADFLNVPLVDQT